MSLSMHGLVNRRVTNKDVQLQNRLVEFTKPPIETGDLHVKRDLYVARNTNLNNLHVAGNLDVSGTIRAAQFLPGQVVNMVVLSNVDLSQNALTINANNTRTVFRYNYTPVIANSYILVEYQTNYSLGGAGNDNVEAYLYSTDVINDNRIGQTAQKWVNSSGGGTRSGTIFPILGRYTNSNTTSKELRVDIYNITDSDPLVINSDISTWLKITEIGR